MSWPEVLDVVEELDEADAFHTAKDGTPFYGRVHRAGDGQSADLLIVSRIRASDWPEQFLKGRFGELQLPEGAELSESTHVAFFDRNVVGILRGIEGPYPSRVEYFLMDKIDFGENGILFKPLRHPDIASRMQDAEYVRRFTMKLPTSDAGRLPEGAPTLRGIFARTAERYGSVEVELTIKLPTRGADRESQDMLSEIQAVVDSGSLSALEKASMTYLDRTKDIGEYVDFLNERLSMTVGVQLVGRTRSVQPGSASSALVEAYEALRPMIERTVPAAG
jgi:hypothetical protein